MKRPLLIIIAMLFSCFYSMAQDMPDKSSDTWYWCTYEYRYTSLPKNQKDYIESKEQQFTTIINAFRSEMHLYYSIYALRGAPATLVWDDKNDVYRDDENTLILSSDFGYLTLLDNDGTDVLRLIDCYEAYGFEEDEDEEDEEIIFDWDDVVQDEKTGWTTYLLYIILALLPAIALLAFILWRDRLRPEPAKELIMAFLMGLLSVPIAVLLETWVGNIGLSPAYRENWVDCLKTAFLGAAIPEEFAKLLVLWLFFKWRKKHDEYMDGIVYAACIGLAFATLENIQYVFYALNLASHPIAVSTGVTRALTAVPGHFGFGIIMGFFFSFYMFLPKKKWLYLILAFVVPVIFHGLYDFFAFMESISGIWLTVITFAFFLVFFVMNNLCVKAIRSAIKLDDAAFFLPQRKQSKQE